MSARPTRRALLAGAAAAPLAAVPALADGAALHENDATLLQIEREIAAIDAEQALIDREDETLWGRPEAKRRQLALRRRSHALTDRWHHAHERIIDTPAASDIGRRAKARVILRWVNRDADGWPSGEDAIAWSLARDVLGIAEGVARAEDVA